MKNHQDIAEKLAESIFTNAEFQAKWQGYLARFGSDIDDLFRDHYKVRVRLAAALQKICDESYKEALPELESFIPSCTTDEEKSILDRLIGECKIHILPDTYPQKSVHYMRCRDMLLNAGFSEAGQCCGHFFRQAAETTVFIINLDDEEYGVSVLYGFAAAASEGTRECLDIYGSDNDTCHVRNMLFIFDEASESAAAETISAFYAQYKDFTKDEILAVKKERQKAFLDHFARVLKPLGFKKTRTKWTKALDGGLALTFEAQKSMYSDQYYFNVIVHDAADFFAQKSYERVETYSNQIYNWQLMSEEQIEKLVQYALTDYIYPKMGQ